MNSRQRIQAAFSKEGTSEIPAVLCYEGIYIGDHWKQLTSCPWWYASETDLDRQVMWRKEVYANIGQDWFNLPFCPTREERESVSFHVRQNGVFRVTRGTMNDVMLDEPTGDTRGFTQPWDNPQGPVTPEDIDSLFPLNPLPDDIKIDGRKDLADLLLGGICADLCPLFHIDSPLQSCVSIWGYSGFMVKLIDDPSLVKYACERIVKLQERRIREIKALGAEVVWIEECYLDMVSPDMYKDFNAPYIQSVVDMIRAAGMKSVYYHTGDPARKLGQLLAIGADAVSFEEGKKGFKIDILDIVDAVQGNCTVLGNLDATTFLPVCTENELKAEIARHIAAGRRNGSRFVMSMGSPVTPGTPAAKVKLYCDLVHSLGQ